MELKDLKPRAMTFKEFEEYTEFLADNAKQEREETENDKNSALLKGKNRVARWIMKHIYGIDPDTLSCSWMTVMKFTDATENLSMESELEDEKNFGKSGNGELEAAQNSVKLAEKPLNNGAEN